jgi:hypothetical protein
MPDQIPRKETELKDDRKLISPPILEQAYACAKVVKVISFIPFATIEIQLNGSIVASQAVGFPEPNGALINLPSPLAGGEVLRARQKTPIATSDWSNTITAVKYTQDFPAGLPRPEINPAPVYECGSRTGVGNLLVGADVWITADGTQVGMVSGCNDQQGVNVTPDYGLNQDVIAQSSLCNDKSPLSAVEKSKAFTYPLPTPGFDAVYEGSQQIRITNIANGARVSLKINGASMGTSRCWGGSLLWGLAAPLSAGASLEATQKLCPGQPDSPVGGTTVLPCGSLPAPLVYPVQVGATSIMLQTHVWGALVKVYINNVKVGEGTGTIIPLTVAVQWNDTILVGQELGACKSAFLTVLKPMCVAPPLSFNPSSRNLFPVGWKEYNQSGAKGNVFYPAEEDGENKKFNKKLAALGRSPIVFMAHGNHDSADPSYKGYNYFQRDLAKMGFIAVSVDCNAVNWPNSGGGVANIEARVDLIIKSIALFQTFDSSASNTFSSKIDFSRVGLMGHSRGGDAVVMAPEVISLSGVSIKCVLALAPTDFRGSLNGTDVNPKKFEFMTILPAGDGDVWENNGARFYDRCAPPRFKSQLYVFFTNHNFFNREWLLDEGMGPARMARIEHERILSVYGCAFFRNVLMGHSSVFAFITGHALPFGARTDTVHLSIQLKKSTTVDNHEQAGGIATNTMGAPTSQTSLTAAEFAFHQGAGAFDSSFFGNSTGMVITYEKQNATFTSNLSSVQSLKGKEVWIRVAEVFFGSQHADTGFQLGLTDSNGVTAWVDSNLSGGIPDPYEHPFTFKTMLNTMRFPASCFAQGVRRFRIDAIKAIKIRCNRAPKHPPLAFDDLQIV